MKPDEVVRRSEKGRHDMKFGLDIIPSRKPRHSVGKAYDILVSNGWGAFGGGLEGGLAGAFGRLLVALAWLLEVVMDSNMLESTPPRREALGRTASRLLTVGETLFLPSSPSFCRGETDRWAWALIEERKPIPITSQVASASVGKRMATPGRQKVRRG